jgi:phosphate starvation-inducible membrane PsiE
MIADCTKFINEFDRTRLMFDDNYLRLINYIQLLSTYSLKIFKLFTFYLKLEENEQLKESIDKKEKNDDDEDNNLLIKELNCFDIFNEIWKQYYELTTKLKSISINNINNNNYNSIEIRDLCFYSQFYSIIIKYLKESFNLSLKYSNNLNINRLTKIIYLLYYLFDLKSIEISNSNDTYLLNDFKLAKLIITKCFRSLNNSEIMQNGLEQLNDYENVMQIFENKQLQMYLTNLMTNDAKYLS